MHFTIGGDYIPNEKPKKKQGPLKVYIQKKGKNILTCIKNLPLSDQALKECLKSLKSSIGCGGTIKSREIQLQGDHLEKTKTMIKELIRKLKDT